MSNDEIAHLRYQGELHKRLIGWEWRIRLESEDKYINEIVDKGWCLTFNQAYDKIRTFE